MSTFEASVKKTFEAPPGYELIFLDKVTSKQFFVKRITDHDLKIFDPETGAIEPISRFKLNKKFKSSVLNKKLRTKRKAA